MQHNITVVAKRHDATPAAHRNHRTIPLLLLAKARRRLGFLAALFAVLFAVDVPFAIGFAAGYPPLVAADVAAFTLAAIVALLAFWKRVPTGLVLNAGLFLEVALCFLLSLSMTRFYHGMYGIAPPMDGVTPVIIMFPLIVPTPPARSLMASIAAAAAPPLSILFLTWRGAVPLELVPLPGAAMHPALVASWSPAVAVVIAWFASRWVYGMGTELARAHELGSYRLVSLLGSGGMGDVWRARHRLLARPAAIKLIRPDVLAGEDTASALRTMRRFEREAQATAALRSPHTIQVYDFVVSEGGDFYYVMELLEGFACDELVSRFGPMPAGRVAQLLQQVCESLAEAHGADLMHRDIKPANVFVCRYGREVDFVKVLDFGLVRSQDEARGDAQATADNVVVGTPPSWRPSKCKAGAPSTRVRISMRLAAWATGS